MPKLPPLIEQYFIKLLNNELIIAQGCTEPGAIALAASKAREILGQFPNSIEVSVSNNIYKNAKSVLIPNLMGLYGIEAAAIAGSVIGNSESQLQILSSISQENVNKIQEILKKNICTVNILGTNSPVYIKVRMQANNDDVTVEIKDFHTNIHKILKNGRTLFKDGALPQKQVIFDSKLLNLSNIILFSETVILEKVSPLIDAQIKFNKEISQVGLDDVYGSQVGKTILNIYGDNVESRACAAAAAGSDARMGGCPLPVIINAGSGNQGLTVSLPVMVYADHLKVNKEKKYRALILSNLVALHQKAYLDRLSAVCGAVNAACGSGAGITYLYGGNKEQICHTITNTLAIMSGMICDGAKQSCAGKIAISIHAAILAHHLSISQKGFLPGEGIISRDCERTFKNIGRIANVGMKNVDSIICEIMSSE